MILNCSDCNTEIETLHYTPLGAYVLCEVCYRERSQDVVVMEQALNESEQTKWLMH